MISNAVLILFAAALSVEADSNRSDAMIGVTAIVIRPIEISTVSSGGGGTAVTLRNAAAIEVRAAGATVHRQDADTAIVTTGTPGPLSITITY